MEPIIRAATVSAGVRQLKKLGERLPSVASAAFSPSPSMSPEPPSPVGKAPVPLTQAFVSAHALLNEETDEESTRLERDIVALKERVEKEAYAAGLKKGEQAAQKTLNERLEQLAKLASQLGEARQIVLNDAEDGIVEVVHQACCRILGENALLPEVVAQIVRTNLATFKERNDLVVHLNPQDLAVLQEATVPSDLPVSLRWQGDASIQLGGCLIEGASGTLDARLETQMSRLRDALLDTRKTVGGMKTSNATVS